MKAPSTKARFAEAQKLLDYGFNNFSYKKLASKGEIIKTINVNKGTNENVNGIIEEDVGTLMKKGNDKNLEQSINIENIINAPIEKGQKIGDITYKINGEELCTVNIVADKDIPKLNLFTMGKRVYYLWINLLRGC